MGTEGVCRDRRAMVAAQASGGKQQRLRKWALQCTGGRDLSAVDEWRGWAAVEGHR